MPYLGCLTPIIFVGVMLALCGGLGTAIYRSATAPITKVREERVENIVRVFVHNPGEYSVLIEKDGKLIDRSFSWHVIGSGGTVEIATDASQGEPMYATITYYEKEGSDHHQDVVIHVHSPQDLEGGGWSRRVGKHTHTGKTNVLE